MVYLILILCILGIIYLLNKKNQPIKRKPKNNKNIQAIKAKLNEKEEESYIKNSSKNKRDEENISTMEEWDPEGYKKLMSEDNFMSQLTNKTTKKNVQNTPKNQLFKRMIDGEIINCKSLSKISKYNWYISEIKNDRAIGFLLIKDNHQVSALSKTFDVKITSDNDIYLSSFGWTDKYNISQFVEERKISIKYFLIDSVSNMYLRENVKIQLKEIDKDKLYKPTTSDKNVFFICKIYCSSSGFDKNLNIYRLGVTSERLSSEENIKKNVLNKSCNNYGDRVEVVGIFHTKHASRLNIVASEFGEKVNRWGHLEVSFRTLSDLDVENILELANEIDNKIDELDAQDKKLEDISIVYIWKISNRNWFNEDMYKIGITKGKNLHRVKNTSHQSLAVCNHETGFNVDVIGTYKTENADNLVKELLKYGKLPNIEGCAKSTKIRVFNDDELNTVIQQAESFCE